MASQNKKSIKQQVPDPSDSYERSHPEHEAGMGRMDSPRVPPQEQPDAMDAAVGNAQELRQLNAHDVVNTGASTDPIKSVADAKRRGNVERK
jgi:hypothetical protein